MTDESTNARLRHLEDDVDDPSWPNAGGHYQVKEADFSAFPNYAS